MCVARLNDIALPDESVRQPDKVVLAGTGWAGDQNEHQLLFFHMDISLVGVISEENSYLVLFVFCISKSRYCLRSEFGKGGLVCN